MTTQPAGPCYNIIAKVVGWTKDGGARVEALADFPGFPLGSELPATVAEDRKRIQLIDFEFRKRKHGLRVGGAVLLRKATIDPVKGIVCKDVDVMRAQEKEGPCIVKRNAAVYIHPPARAGTVMAKFATLAVLPDARRVKDVDEAANFAKRMVEDASIFGEPSLVLTAAGTGGTVEELPITLSSGHSPEQVESAVRAAVDPDTARLMKSSKQGWWLVPLFKTELEPDPHKQGKVSAQYLNASNSDRPYGPPDEPSWTRTNAVLSGRFSEFFLADVSPTNETTDSKPELLLDLLESNPAA